MIDVQTYDHEGYPVDADCPSARYVKREDYERLQGELRIKSEFLSSRQCPDHSGKWERGRCLQCEIEHLQAQLRSIQKLAGDWIQGVGEEKPSVVLNAIWHHANGMAEPIGESMTCTCKIILKGAGIEIKGFEPISNFRKVAKEPWVEISCTRPDPHPRDGAEHWYEVGCVRVSWIIPVDAVSKGVENGKA